jgi:hypothetical protein
MKIGLDLFKELFLKIMGSLVPGNDDQGDVI